MLRPQLARAARARFVVSPASNEFRKRHFPGVKTAEWNDWRWQNRNRIRSLAQLDRMIEVTADERAAIERHNGPLPVGVTPYYMSLIEATNPLQGLRRTTIPTLAEFDRTPGEQDDPLGEDGHSPVPGLVHRYPDRVLLLVTNFCSVYCRYCTRARLVGASGERALRKADIDRAIEYIAATPTVRDCLISGAKNASRIMNRSGQPNPGARFPMIRAMNLVLAEACPERLRSASEQIIVRLFA